MPSPLASSLLDCPLGGLFSGPVDLKSIDKIFHSKFTEDAVSVGKCSANIVQIPPAHWDKAMLPCPRGRA